MYRTVIIDDEPAIVQLHQSFLQRDPRFQLAQSFHNGSDGLEYLLRHNVDLVILDNYMPRLSGLELLRNLRSSGVTVDVILVTAANDSKTVDSLLKLGVTDYLVKPFTARRFQQALDNFCRQRETISHRSNVSQAELDRLLTGGAGSDASPPKGLQPQTLALIRRCLEEGPPEGCTSEYLAKQSALSTVTVRRYLRYLADMGAAVSETIYGTGGRPSQRYRIPDSRGK